MTGVIVPGKFGTPHQRARQAFSDDLAQMIVPYMNDLGWQTVVNDLLTVAASFLSQSSKNPAQDLLKAATYLQRFDWQRAQRLYMAAQQGIQPEQVKERDRKPNVENSTKDP